MKATRSALLLAAALFWTVTGTQAGTLTCTWTRAASVADFDPTSDCTSSTGYTTAVTKGPSGSTTVGEATGWYKITYTVDDGEVALRACYSDPDDCDYAVSCHPVVSKAASCPVVAAPTAAPPPSYSVHVAGDNNDGNLGTGDNVSVQDPTAHTYAFTVAAIEAGSTDTMFLTSTGTVYCAGKNQYGLCGVGDTVTKTTPVEITGLTGTVVSAHACHEHSLFLMDDGTVYAAGRNNNGQLGTGTTTDSTSPVAVSEMSGLNVIEIGCGDSFSAFRTNTGAVYMVGKNQYGNFGNSASGVATNTAKVQVMSSHTVTGLAICADRSYFIVDGDLYAAGYGAWGRLCTGLTTSVSTPIQICTATSCGAAGTVASVTCQRETTMVLNAAGEAFGCGVNDYGQIAASSGGNKNSPTAAGVFTSKPFAKVSGNAFGYSFLWLTTDGEVWGSGQGAGKNFGSGTTGTTTGVQIMAGTTVSDIEAGGGESTNAASFFMV